MISSMHRIYHDFNKLFPGGPGEKTSAPLVCMGTKRDLDALGLTLEAGMEVILYEPDVAEDGSPDSLEVKATIRYDSKEGCFMADFYWDDLMYRSEAETKRRETGASDD